LLIDQTDRVLAMTPNEVARFILKNRMGDAERVRSDVALRD
jgi:hypothetical protein